MNRRNFIAGSGGALGLVGLTRLWSCRALPPHDDYDPGPYTVGSEHLIFDDDGAAFLIDVPGHRLVRLDDGSDAGVELATFGTDPGQVNHPVDAVLDAKGNVYVLDRGNSRVQVLALDGRLLAVFGERGSGEGEMHLPHDIALSGERLYVADTLNHRVLGLDLEGRLVCVLGAPRGEKGALNGPSGVAIAPTGEVHVLDSGEASVEVFSAEGAWLRRYGGYGTAPGEMLGPRSIAADADGRVFVADPAADFIHVFSDSGAFLGRFRPVDESGARVAPMRVSFRPGGGLYVWTAGCSVPRLFPS